MVEPLTCRHLKRSLGICGACLSALSDVRRRAKQTAFAMEAAQVRADSLAFEDRCRAGGINRTGTMQHDRSMHAPLDVEGPYLDLLGHAHAVELNFDEGR